MIQPASLAGSGYVQTIPKSSPRLDSRHATGGSASYDPTDHMYHPGSHVEVLDLTHSMSSAFGVQFDDPRWKDYIANLKPLVRARPLETWFESTDNCCFYCPYSAYFRS